MCSSIGTGTVSSGLVHLISSEPFYNLEREPMISHNFWWNLSIDISWVNIELFCVKINCKKSSTIFTPWILDSHGRRKLFYGGEGWVKMSDTMVDRRRKIKKTHTHTHWLKRPKAVPQKTKFGPKYKGFKISYLQFLFWKYYFRHTTLVYTFQWTPSEFFLFEIL